MVARWGSLFFSVSSCIQAHLGFFFFLVVFPSFCVQCKNCGLPGSTAVRLLVFNAYIGREAGLKCSSVCFVTFLNQNWIIHVHPRRVLVLRACITSLRFDEGHPVRREGHTPCVPSGSCRSICWQVCNFKPSLTSVRCIKPCPEHVMKTAGETNQLHFLFLISFRFVLF